MRINVGHVGHVYVWVHGGGRARSRLELTELTKTARVKSHKMPSSWPRPVGRYGRALRGRGRQQHGDTSRVRVRAAGVNYARGFAKRRCVLVLVHRR